MKRTPENNGKLIVSVFDYTGEWAKPYIEAGYPVFLWDKKEEGDILEGSSRLISDIEEACEVYADLGMKLHGFLFAPPCDDFAVSGARWWKGKDSAPPLEEWDSWNSVDYSKAYVLICLHLVDYYREHLKFWALENPVGRIETVIPELKPYRKLLFNPCDYGDAYTKKTILWGEFNPSLKKTPVEPIMYELNGKRGSFYWAKLGGKSERTKALRSK